MNRAMLKEIEKRYPDKQTFDWDWKKQITTHCWHELCVTGWPGWKEDPHKDNGQPYSRLLTIRKLRGSSSHEIAVRFDGIANYQFYYRDFTASGLPWTYEGEQYQSEFYFQSDMDLILFNHMVSDYILSKEIL